MRITRSGRVVRETQRLVDEPEAGDDRTDEDESVEMDSSEASSDPGSLEDFIVETGSETDDEDDEDSSYTGHSPSDCSTDSNNTVFIDFIQLLCRGGPPEKTAELLDLIVQKEVPEDLFAGALASRLDGW